MHVSFGSNSFMELDTTVTVMVKMSHTTRHRRETAESVRCPKCGGLHVSYASTKQTSLTCHDCDFSEVDTIVMAGGKDPATELIKVFATGALVAIGIAGAIGILNALFGDSKE